MTNPGRCDLCHTQLVIGAVTYVYFTPNTATEAEAEAGKGFWAEDPEWAACVDRHRRLQMLDAGLMTLETWLDTQLDIGMANMKPMGTTFTIVDPTLNAVLAVGARDYARGVLRGFIYNRGPDFVTEINEGIE